MVHQNGQGGLPNLLDIAIQQLNEAADRLGLDQSMRRILSKPQRILTVSMPVCASTNGRWVSGSF